MLSESLYYLTEVGYNSLDQIDVAHQLRRPNTFPITPSITRKESTNDKYRACTYLVTLKYALNKMGS